MKLSDSKYYLLNATWGLVMTSIGLIVTMILITLGHEPKWHKNTWYFHIPGSWGGITLGTCIIVCREDESLLNHEYGHTVQNAVYGIGMPFIGIASLLRCVYRDILVALQRPLTAYDSVWFEWQATYWGNLNN